MLKSKKIMSLGVSMALLGSVAASPAVAATGASGVSTTISSSSASGQLKASDTAKFASMLEGLFTKAIKLDAQGNVTSYSEKEAAKIVGAEEAKKLTAAVNQSRSLSSTSGGPQRAAASQSFTDCMIENSVLGLINGLSTGTYAVMIEKRMWTELAEDLMPRLIKAGVAGGVAGVVTGLAASAVQCQFFND